MLRNTKETDTSHRMTAQDTKAMNDLTTINNKKDRIHYKPIGAMNKFQGGIMGVKFGLVPAVLVSEEKVTF